MYREVVSITRPHDHLYDPVYNVADQRDHWRQQNKATQGRLERVPEYNNFFSEVQAVFPRHSIRLKAQDVVPKFISRDWTGPTGAEPGVDYKMKAAQVRGTNRHLYFKRPVIPGLNNIPPEVVLQPTSGPSAVQVQGPQVPQGVLSGQPLEEEVVPIREPEQEQRTRTLGVQSLYREADVQTDPYTPDYTLKPGAQPEVLTVATLTYGNGLPPGIAEVEMIEKARWKREFEAALPPITDEASFELRRKLMQAQELKEWGDREDEMIRLHEQRLGEIKKALDARVVEKERFNEIRIDHLEQQKIMEQEEESAEVQRRRIKALRKMTNHRKSMDADRKRDIIGEYANASSNVYAPITRLGIFPDKNADKFEAASGKNLTYHDVLDLEAYIPASVTTPQVSLPSRHPKPKTLQERKMAKVGVALELIDNLIKTGKMEDQDEMEEVGGEGMQITGYKPKKLQERPPTPERPPATEDDDRTNSVILIQRLLRGRAVQNEMFEGKEKRLDLIRELRASEDDLITAEEADQLHVQAHVDMLTATAVEQLQGEFVGMTMDYLAKELVRFNEEKKIAEFVKAAEELRRQREAEESGRRQEEELLRGREEEQFAQINNIHQETVDTLVDTMLSDAADSTSSAWAIEETLEKETLAKKERASKLPKSVQVKDLLQSFLYPSVKRELVERQVAAHQARYSQAARTAILQGVEMVQAEAVAAKEEAEAEALMSNGDSASQQASSPGGSRNGSIDEGESGPQ